MGIAEMQVGIEWRYYTLGGTGFYFRGLWEAQIWNGSDSLIANNETGLMGFTLALAIER